MHPNESEVEATTELQSVDWLGRTNHLVFVKDNDLYVKLEHGPGPLRLTHTGVPGVVYNGVPDWLYQGTLLAIARSV